MSPDPGKHGQVRFRTVDPLDDVGPTPFDDAGWRSEFFEWISQQLRSRSLESAGALDVRVRPWSIVVRVPTVGGGQIWAKANPPAMAFEAGLARALGEWAPGFVLVPLVVEASAGWLLLPDGGVVLPWPDPDEPAGAPLWQPLRRYAELQQVVAPRVDEMLLLGVPDYRPAALPAIVEHLLERVPVPEVAAKRSLIAEWCAELDESDVAASLDHADLHYEQVFPDPEVGYRFFDWGMAAIAHPFASLLGPRSHYTGDPAAQAGFTTAYLQAWPGQEADLRRVADLAAKLGLIGWATLRYRNFPGATRHEAIEAHVRKLLLWLVSW